MPMPGALAVGTVIARRPPLRSRRAELPHRAPALGHDAEPHVGKRMAKARGWQPEVGQSFHTLPGQPAGLTPPPERAAPVPADMAIERVDRPAVGGNGKVIEETAHHPLQVEPLLRDRPVHHPPYRLFDLPKLLPQPLTNGVPQDEEGPSPARSTDVCETEKGEGFGFAEVSGLVLALREAPEFDDPGLLRMQLQPEPLQTLPQVVQKPLGIRAMLETHHGVVGIADDDHLAAGMSPPPLVDPQVVDVVPIDIR